MATLNEIWEEITSGVGGIASGAEDQAKAFYEALMGNPLSYQIPVVGQGLALLDAGQFGAEAVQEYSQTKEAEAAKKQLFEQMILQLAQEEQQEPIDQSIVEEILKRTPKGQTPFIQAKGGQVMREPEPEARRFTATRSGKGYVPPEDTSTLDLLRAEAIKAGKNPTDTEEYIKSTVAEAPEWKYPTARRKYKVSDLTKEVTAALGEGKTEQALKALQRFTEKEKFSAEEAAALQSKIEQQMGMKKETGWWEYAGGATALAAAALIAKWLDKRYAKGAGTAFLKRMVGKGGKAAGAAPEIITAKTIGEMAAPSIRKALPAPNARRMEALFKQAVAKEGVPSAGGAIRMGTGRKGLPMPQGKLTGPGVRQLTAREKLLEAARGTSGTSPISPVIRRPLPKMTGTRTSKMTQEEADEFIQRILRQKMLGKKY